MIINKSQDQSLACVRLYLPRPVFSHGQLYMEISRVQSKQGLKILIHDKDNNPLQTTTNVVFKEILQSVSWEAIDTCPDPLSISMIVDNKYSYSELNTKLWFVPFIFMHLSTTLLQSFPQIYIYPLHLSRYFNHVAAIAVFFTFLR